ncbi:galactoside alpha-(1,2)-fucosyltransferase 1-like [Tigriopus californicus]|nr:galactoside alpha-(1,2)-fucosyltransferase 1-like [Tigriopus californicus]
MMKTLKFKPDLTQRAAQIIDHVVAQMGRPKKEITFIGVHNRRTDHLEYFERYFKKKPLKPSYFHDAMDIFRDEYDHPAFIFVSDDMEWARAKIKNKLGDVFFVGTGNPDSEVDIGTDLALLASCNATILSRGTFSIWAAILSGGEYYTEFGTIVPEHKIHPDLDFYHQDFKFK